MIIQNKTRQVFVFWAQVSSELVIRSLRVPEVPNLSSKIAERKTAGWYCTTKQRNTQ
jgi:hypothetical protein